MKFVKWFLIILMVVVVAGAGGGYLYLKATLPEYDGVVVVRGLSAPVEIVRDSCGVPHIFARNEEDGYFGIGYCMAQDRLFQMEVMRLLAQGRLSEMMGEATVELDKLHRTILAAYDLTRAREAVSPEALASAEAFIRGVNFYIEHPQGPPSVEFLLLGHRPEPYDFEDFASFAPLYTWMVNGSFESEMLKAAVIEKVGEKMAASLFIDHNVGFPTTIPEGESLYPGFEESDVSHGEGATKETENEPFEDAALLLESVQRAQAPIRSLGFQKVMEACNSLVISGEHTESGKPILAQDFHFPHVIPSYIYEAHLSTPDFTTAGYLFVGLPYVFGGQNEHVAWVFTAGCGDEIDFYIEKLHPNDPNKYLFGDNYEKMWVKKEIIKVKGRASVKFDVRLTWRGPVIDYITNDFLEPESSNTVLSMRITSPDFLTDHEAMYRMNTAKNADDYVAAAKFFKSPGEHWIYADSNGDIGYIFGGAMPLRKGFDGTVPVPGWNGKYEWAGYIPPEQQPQVRNPKMGFMNTSNAKPAPDSYPYPQGDDYVPPDRLTRVREIISETIAEKGKFSVEDVDRVFRDSHIIMAREWVPFMISALDGETLNANEQNALDKLVNWDYVSRRDSAAALIFQAALVRMVENAFSPHLGEDLYKGLIGTNSAIKGLREVLREEESPWFDNPNTQEVEGRRDLLVGSFREAVAKLENDVGPDVDAWALGDCLTLTLNNSLTRIFPFLGRFLDVGPLRMGGGLIAPFAISYSLGNPFDVIAGTQARFIVDFADRKNCRIVNMPGISENFMSPHYDDQVDMWYNFKSRPLMLYREEVDKDTKYVMRMLPE